MVRKPILMIIQDQADQKVNDDGSFAPVNCSKFVAKYVLCAEQNVRCANMPGMSQNLCV